MKIITFFNNKSGVGKTSLVYHLGWTFSELGYRVLIADLDPQSNLTAMCLDEERVEKLWAANDADRETIRGAIEPIVQGIGDIAEGHSEELASKLALLPGDIRLSDFEDHLSDAWAKCTDRKPAPFRATTSLYRVILGTARRWSADLVLVDVGPNLGAINRATLIGADHVVIPMGADLFSIQGLKNLGPTLRSWRREWKDRAERNPVEGLDLPSGAMTPLGYIIMQPNVYAGRVTGAYERWLREIPEVYDSAVLGEEGISGGDRRHPHHLATLKHYRSLMPMAQTARKPIFHLTSADGAIGSHSYAVQAVGREFRALARTIGAKAGMEPPGA